ncbi:sulfurtransferase TusA family protein [Dasania marina]|uniref:sulfurtransferase TusA family protein n=1 Tax=Dasania marina TaxID=471499 RepID=UPI0003801B00|nr:sulfurtransferase TusA family protein [Dasania marina]|tara:strand:+ start:40061 stop:40291 length:231 start_codon:yes stop_codon:yes gene_type:complete
MSEHIHELDLCGLQCPLPLLKTKLHLNGMAVGERVRVLATDAGSLRDFKAYAELSAHQLISSEQQQGVYIYVIERG